MSSNLPKVGPDAPQLPDAFNGEIYKSVGKYARSAVLYAFEQMGGADGLARWGMENEDEFYTKLFPKIIARESEVTHHKTVDQLMDIIDGEYEVEGDFDEVQPGEIPQAYQPIAKNWNASDYDFENAQILSDATYSEDSVEGHDLVDFED
jgi:hypothetical protein